VSLPSLTKEFLGYSVDSWGLNASGFSYVVLPDDITKKNLETRLVDFAHKYLTEGDTKQKYLLQSLEDIHFDNRFNDEAVEKSTLITLAILGAFILTIACINFINLATALAIKKSKEIGVRKTLGAVRQQLTVYFLGETFVITLLAVLLALGVVEWTLPLVNNFTGKQMPESLLGHPGLLAFIFMLLITVTLLSGLYPGLILSRFNPVDVLKNKITGQGTSGSLVRKALVVFQFLIAQALIIGTLIVSDQMSFFRNKPLGFTKDAVINVSMPEHKEATLRALTSRLQLNPEILSVSYSIGAPVSNNHVNSGYRLTDAPRDRVYDVEIKMADIHYGETYGLELVAGRWITEAEERLSSDELPEEDQHYAVIVNEFAVRQLGFKNPDEIIGKHVTLGLNDIDAPVVGVVKDFHTASLHKSIGPVVIVNFPYFYYDAGIKVSTSNLSETLAFIEKSWNEVYPDYYFQYTFLDQHVASRYKQEERTFTLFKILSALSIFIGCLGLYGLISFMANQKLKEVGIRKVMGASVTSIILLFSKEFIKLILIAFIIAAPLSWYFMRQWLQSFQYHINIQWWVFAIGIATTMFISLATVSYRAIRAAIINPVTTLRSE
ncbi:ABC transporter permease, partial [Chryseosolibacter indicus]